MSRFQYLLMMGACLGLTLPLELVLGARVYRRPRRLALTLAAVAAPFAIWDAIAIARGHWWFSPRYTTGWMLPAGIPIEELVFFLVIPICGLLTFEVVKRLAGARRDA